MIYTPTVLVLGAGASMHLGYPSGIDLKTQIIELQNDKYSPEYALIQELNIDLVKIKEFCNALAYSGKSSVDAFLENREEYIILGKLLIAVVLTRFESLDNLFHPKDNWYNYLFQKMDASMSEFENNKLSIITFNYDRSLETYLHTALMNSYRLTPENAGEIMENTPILHVYGKLGDLEWQTPDGRKYSRIDEVADIKLAAKGINIIHEGNQSDIVLENAKSLLLNAGRILFLGFGYGLTNLQRLGFTGGDNYPLSTIYGTCFHFSKMERDSLLGRFKPGKIHLGNSLDTIEDFLREELIL